MKLIRENLFLLVLIGVVLVVGGILIATASSIGGEVADRIAARKTLSDRLSRSRGDLVNDRIVAAEEERGRRIVAEANRTIAFQVRSNQAPYKVLREWRDMYDGNLRVVLPDAFGTAAFLRDVERRGGGADVHAGQPPGVAVGQDPHLVTDQLGTSLAEGGRPTHRRKP